jgi:hypothetical protein
MRQNVILVIFKNGPLINYFEKKNMHFDRGLLAHGRLFKWAVQGPSCRSIHVGHIVLAKW